MNFATLVERHAAILDQYALAAARTLGLVEVLAVPRGVSAIARLLAIAPHRLRALLDVLALSGAVVQSASGRNPKYQVGLLPPAGPPPPPLGWGLLAQVLQSGEPLPDETADAAALVQFHDHLWQTSQDAAQAIAAVLPSGKLLDLGCGAGTYSAAYLAHHPQAVAVALDRADVVQLARARLAALPEPVASRVTWLAGEAADTPTECDFDAVLLSHVLHLHGPASNAALLAKAGSALRPGGILAVQDLDLRPDRRGPAASVYFSLNMALYTRKGRVYPPTEIAGHLRRLGWQVQATQRLAACPGMFLLLATKPLEGAVPAVT